MSIHMTQECIPTLNAPNRGLCAVSAMQEEA